MAADKNSNINTILRQLRSKLFSFIRQRVDSYEDAEDILQDVFVQFVGNPEPIDQVGNWLYRVAGNKITDRYRKHRLPLAEDIFPGESDEGIDWTEIIGDDIDNPETVYLRSIFWGALRSALNELPGEQRDIFIMHEIDGIPFREMSDIMGLPVATLISRKRYAVLHLRERLTILKQELLNY